MPVDVVVAAALVVVAESVVVGVELVDAVLEAVDEGPLGEVGAARVFAVDFEVFAALRVVC